MASEQIDVLMIDDDHETVLGLISELHLAGYSVNYVPTVEDALSKLRTVQFGIILVDLKMPIAEGMSLEDAAGIEIVRDLRAGRLGTINQATPYIVLSAQEFRLGALEKENFSKDFEIIKEGRMGSFQKGDDHRPLIAMVTVAIGSRR